MGREGKRKRHAGKEAGLGEILESTMLIPIVRDSDWKLHRPLAWGDLEDELRSFASEKAFSGPDMFILHRKIKTVRGEWKEVKDRSLKYFLDVPESRVGEFRQLVHRQRDRFDQRVIRITVDGRPDYIS